MTLRFDHDDAGYLNWLDRNPSGYVLNIRAAPDLDYVVLHRSTCHTIRAHGALEQFTGRGYRKVCGDLASLSTWAGEYGRPDGSFSKRCGWCKP